MHIALIIVFKLGKHMLWIKGYNKKNIYNYFWFGEYEVRYDKFMLGPKYDIA